MTEKAEAIKKTMYITQETKVQHSENKSQQHKMQVYKSAITGECNRQHWDANAMQSAHERVCVREKEDAKRKTKEEKVQP